MDTIQALSRRILRDAIKQLTNPDHRKEATQIMEELSELQTMYDASLGKGEKAVRGIIALVDRVGAKDDQLDAEDVHSMYVLCQELRDSNKQGEQCCQRSDELQRRFAEVVPF